MASVPLEAEIGHLGTASQASVVGFPGWQGSVYIVPHGCWEGTQKPHIWYVPWTLRHVPVGTGLSRSLCISLL